MRKKVIFTWIVAISALLLTTQPASAVPFVSLDVLNDNIMVGDSFDVAVVAYQEGIDDDLIAFEFNVKSPDPFFMYTGFTIGPYFDDTSDINDALNVGGLWDLDSELGDSVLLATLSFRAVCVGTGDLSVLGLSDYFLGLLYWPEGFSDILAYTSISVNSVPEPATILLLAAGIGGLGLVRRRRVTARRAKGCA